MNQRNTDFSNDVEVLVDTAASQGKWRRFLPRWNLLTLILLASVVCTWSLYYRLRHDNARLRIGIQTMEGQSRKLRIVHPDRAAVVKLPQGWHDEYKWEVALPDEQAVTAGGVRYKLCLATREIENLEEVPPAAGFVLPPGRHHVQVKVERERDGWAIVALLDDQPVIELNESADWNPGRGGSTSASYEEPFQPRDIAWPLVLYEELYVVETPDGGSHMPDGPSNGVRMWLQPLTDSEKDSPPDL